MQIFPTRMCNVTAWRHSTLRAHWVLALVGGGGAEGEVCVLRSPGIAASPISLLSMGGVCGRSLTAEKILFTGRQTCSLYLILWLCDADACSLIYGSSYMGPLFPTIHLSLVTRPIKGQYPFQVRISTQGHPWARLLAQAKADIKM